MKFKKYSIPINKSIKAFTVFELLISMTLTGILVAFAFTGFNMMQQLFNDYNKQSIFISDINQLHSALFYLSNKSSGIEKIDDKHLSFTSDSSTAQLVIEEKNILLKFASHTDTFKLEPKDATITLLTMSNQLSSNLVEKFDCDVFYKTQKFHVSFQKQYDAQPILKSTLVLQPPDEFN